MTENLFTDLKIQSCIQIQLSYLLKYSFENLNYLPVMVLAVLLLAPSKARLDVIVYILAISVFKSKDGLVIFSAAGGVHCIKDLLLHRGWVWLVLNPSILPSNQNGGHTSKPPQPSITLPAATSIHNLSK